MKFKKTFLFVFVVCCAFLLVACDREPTLKTLTFYDVTDITVEYEAEFNVLDGISVKGNDDVDYSEHITYTSLATIDSTTNLLDTTETGTFLIKYEIEVGELKASKNRMVTVSDPERTSMVLNADFSLGVTGWDTYAADGGTIDLSVEDGALKAEVVSGSNPYTPRVTQMGIPFEIDTTYEISFKAKSSVADKLVHLQVGEILADNPWFTNFKPDVQVEFVTLTNFAFISSIEMCSLTKSMTSVSENPISFKNMILLSLGSWSIE